MKHVKPATTDDDPCFPPWQGMTTCRRPYGRSLYGRGPYGRCNIIGAIDWAPPGSLEPPIEDPLWMSMGVCGCGKQ